MTDQTQTNPTPEATPADAQTVTTVDITPTPEGLARVMQAIREGREQHSVHETNPALGRLMLMVWAIADATDSARLTQAITEALDELAAKAEELDETLSELESAIDDAQTAADNARNSASDADDEAREAYDYTRTAADLISSLRNR